MSSRLAAGARCAPGEVVDSKPQPKAKPGMDGHFPANTAVKLHELTRMALRAFLSPIHVNPCNPWSNIQARRIHLADHAPKPP
jgi:hypothetical protein